MAGSWRNQADNARLNIQTTFFVRGIRVFWIVDLLALPIMDAEYYKKRSVRCDYHDDEVRKGVHILSRCFMLARERNL